MKQRSRSESPRRELPLDLIDEPELAMRQSMDPAGLEDLAESIRAVGVLLPLLVHQEGGRFRIDDGHRRYIAAARAGLEVVPVMVRDVKAISGEAVKCHANYHREDVNPAEEAQYLAVVLERDCGGDVDQICKMLRLRREYVEQRLLLLRGDPAVLRVLAERRISLAVARELNRIADEGYRRMYLDAAARGGATARMVQEWRQAMPTEIPPAMAPAGDGSNQFTTRPAPVMTMRCYLCDQTDRPYDLELLYLCRSGCRQILERLSGREAAKE